MLYALYLDHYQKLQSKGFREEKIPEGQTNNWAQFREPARRFVSSFRSAASTNYPCFQSDNNIDRDHLWNHLRGLLTSQMWECRTDSNVHNYVLLAGMATGPALLERKQESPSSEQHATMLLHRYRCWPYRPNWGGCYMNFILKFRHGAHWITIVRDIFNDQPQI